MSLVNFAVYYETRKLIVQIKIRIRYMMQKGVSQLIYADLKSLWYYLYASA